MRPPPAVQRREIGIGSSSQDELRKGATAAAMTWGLSAHVGRWEIMQRWLRLTARTPSDVRLHADLPARTDPRVMQYTGLPARTDLKVVHYTRLPATGGALCDAIYKAVSCGAPAPRCGGKTA
jgi:hypothetical protein